VVNVINVVISHIQTAEQVQACAQLMATSDPWVTLGIPHSACLAAAGNENRERYVAYVDGVFAGFVILNLQGGFVGYLQTIAVVPQFRSRGVGAALVQFVEERIFKDFANIFICVSGFNTRAQQFYARLGYETIGELRDYLVAGQSEILLRKTRGPMRKVVTSDG
jgi:[ribosomal protein S18]-alanine N-acetyltransferase